MTNSIGYILGSFIFAALIAAVWAYVIMLLWNNFLVGAVSFANTISLMQAIGIWVLFTMLRNIPHINIRNA